MFLGLRLRNICKIEKQNGRMARSIRCTNPNCEAIIEVPEGAVQVICPSCNTWHFPSSTSGQDPTPEENRYASPPATQDAAEAPPGLPIYDPYPTQPPSGPSSKEPEAPPAIGYLISSDGRRYPLKAGQNVIGRKNADIILSDRTVSRRHCVIEVTQAAGNGWEYIIYDIGHLEGTASTNGVLISARSLRLENYERIPITNGMTIRLGDTELTLKY